MNPSNKLDRFIPSSSLMEKACSKERHPLPVSQNMDDYSKRLFDTLFPHGNPPTLIYGPAQLNHPIQLNPSPIRTIREVFASFLSSSTPKHAFSMSRKGIFAYGFEGRCLLWRSQDDYSSCLLEDQEWISAVSWNRNSQTLAIGYENGDLEIMDCERGQSIRSLPAPPETNCPGLVDWHNENVVIFSEDHGLGFFDLREKQSTSLIRNRSQIDWTLIHCSPKGDHLAASVNNQCIKIVNLRHHKPEILTIPLQKKLIDFSWHPEEEQWCATTCCKSESLIKGTTLTPHFTSSSLQSPIALNALSWCDTKYLATSAIETLNEISIWRATDLKPVSMIPGKAKRAWTLLHQPESPFLLSVIDEGLLHLHQFCRVKKKKPTAKKSESKSLFRNVIR